MKMTEVRVAWWRRVVGVAVFLGVLTAGAAPLRVTTTVSMVTDLVQRIGGAEVEVTGLMGAGVDPHLYKATTADLGKLQRADVIFYSGLHLEGKMQDVFSRLEKGPRPVVAVTSGIPHERLLKWGEGEDSHDPHVWFDVELWALCVDPIAATLSKAVPEKKEFFATQAHKVRAEMLELHRWAKAKAAELPAERRVLVTSHDAYNYFGRAYGFEVVGLQGISTVTEAGLADMAKLVDFIKARKLKAIFVESSVPHATIERLSRDAGVKIGGELFSDAMGTSGQMENGYDLGTYDGMVRHNLTTIVEASK